MKFIASKRNQRVASFGLVAVLVVSVFAASVPFIFSQKADAASIVVVNAANTQGWIKDDTRDNGHVAYVPDTTAFNGNGALSLKTDAAPVSGQDKAQYMKYFSAPVALSSITGELSFDTKQNSASFSAGTPSYQIPVLLNGPSGTGDFATIVYEPYVDQGNAAIQNGAWQHWTINPSSSKLYVTKTITGQNGNVVASQGSSPYTLDQIKQYFPNATVLGFGLNVGSNNPGYDTEADNFTFNGTTYDFAYTTLAAPTNLIPVANSYTKNPSFDNTWNAVTGAVKYEYIATYQYGGSLQTYTDTSDAGNYVLGGATIIRHNNGAPNATYAWKVRAIDTNGVAGAWSVEQKVTVDTIAPAAEIVTPTLNQKVAGTVPIQVNVNDLNPNYTYIEINKGGVWKAATTLGGATPTWNFDTTTLPDGTYTIKVDAIDKAGNGTEVTRNFTIDNQAPDLTVKTGIEAGQQLTIGSNGVYKVVSFKLHDNDQVVKYTINGTLTNVTPAPWSDANFITVGDGRGTVEGANTIVLYDATGNTTTLNFVIDTTAPTATITGPVTSSGNQPTITGTVDDPTATITLLVGETSYTIQPTDTSWSFTVPAALADGQYALSVYATDTTGNKGTTTTGNVTIAPVVLTPVTTSSNDATTPQPATRTAARITPTIIGPAAVAQVLGESTTNAAANTQTGTSGVKGAETENKTVAAVTNNNDGTFLGVAWYWWILLLAAISLIIWWIVAAARRRSAES